MCFVRTEAKKKIHRVFNQLQWIKPYVKFKAQKTDLRCKNVSQINEQ